MATNTSVFIDKTTIVSELTKIGTGQWEDFTASELFDCGNAKRCEISADGKKAIIDFYFKKDGTTTIRPTGPNTDISTKLKILLEERCAYTAKVENKSYALRNVPDIWSDRLIRYLESLEGVQSEKKLIETQPVHSGYEQIVFTSTLGDRLIVNNYPNGTLMLQGKPAYLYCEAISLLSYCENVSVEDIIGSINTFHDIDIKTVDIRNELKTLLPNAYGNIDDMIMKLLSPSISLRKVNMELEDYSCYAFPALRALEGYLKYLFGLKGISIANNFAGRFAGNVLTQDTANQISDPVFQAELERIYVYFKSNRHVIFHVDQVLISTSILEEKQEADEIVNNVLNLIETSYKAINGI